MKSQLEKIGQFEITENADILTCRYVCGLIPSQELFAPAGTAIIKSFKIRTRDLEHFFNNDVQKLREHIAARLIQVACFDVDLTLYDIHTWYKNDAPRVRNLDKIKSVLQRLQQLPMWRSIIITNNHLYNITKHVPQGRDPDLADMLGGEFFAKKYSRLDMQINNSKAYPLRCYYEELRAKSAIDDEGFLICNGDEKNIIDVVGAFLLDDDLSNLDYIEKHGLFPIHAKYTAIETHPQRGVLQVELNDEAQYIEEIQSILSEGLLFNTLISELPKLYQATSLPVEDDDVVDSRCCCNFFKRHHQKSSDKTPLIDRPSSDRKGI